MDTRDPDSLSDLRTGTGRVPSPDARMRHQRAPLSRAQKKERCGTSCAWWCRREGVLPCLLVAAILGSTLSCAWARSQASGATSRSRRAFTVTSHIPELNADAVEELHRFVDFTAAKEAHKVRSAGLAQDGLRQTDAIAAPHPRGGQASVRQQRRHDAFDDGACRSGVATGEGCSRRRSLLGIISEDCTMGYLDSACPDVRPLLLFKAANVDPASALKTWTIPCSLSLQNKAAADVASTGVLSGAGCRIVQAHVCRRWTGIACNSRLRVTNVTVNPGVNFPNSPEMCLWGNWSVGQSIPPEFGELEELQRLDLANNYSPSEYIGGLIGTIPEELGQLKKLLFLDLSSNRLWGSVPDTLGTLSSLNSLNLQGNNLTGSIPGALGSLGSLSWLNLGGNLGMGGSIPDTLGSLASLQYISLTSLPLASSIPDSMSALRSLTWLDLSLMGLTGQLPGWISNFTNLSYLELSDNELQGSLPEGFSNLRALGSLSMSNNQLSGSIPASMVTGLCKDNSLFALIHLGYNQLSGPFPFGFSACTAIYELDLSGNRLSGSFPPLSFFTSLPYLNNFQINSNSLSGTVPGELTRLPQLALLWVGFNNLSGPAPRVHCVPSTMNFNFTSNRFTGQLDEILDVDNLTNCVTSGQDGIATANLTLVLSNNSISGTVPPAIFTLRSMQQVLLDGNNLTGPLPETTKCSPNLQVFSVTGNQLNGSIPRTLGNCRALQKLGLARNQFSGRIPETLRAIGNNLQTLEIQENQLTGSVPGSFNYFQQLRLLNLSHNTLSGSLSRNLSELPNLSQLDLSSNQIEGPLPPDLGNLSFLNYMDLHSNFLSGPIPITIAPPNLPRLTHLDLSNNALSGPIPWGFTNSSAANLTINLSSNNLSGPIPGGANSTFALTLPESAVANNTGLCGGSGYPPCPDPNSSQLSTGAVVGICVGAAVALLLIGGLTFWFIRKRNEWAGGTMLVFEKLDFHLGVDDILEATENFSDKYKLGRGGFGTVYRATLQDGRTVAIKRLAAQSTQGDREFQAEMQTLGNIRHRNLVVLVAAYIAPPPSSERLLIYNFLSGGSLDNILSSVKDMPKDSPYRQWEVRRRIALDVARGMKYLHHDCTPRIIHRDMKPANVLMDDQLVAHVADFGLARELDASKSHMSTAVFGTIGYLAPEYTQRGRLTFKSDVFAYGVLLLQIITGKQPTDENVAERGLARWVGASSTASVIDDRMEAGPHTNQILGAIKLALLCTSRVPADRPSMAEVVHLLENLDDFAKGITAADDAPLGHPEDEA